MSDAKSTPSRATKSLLAESTRLAELEPIPPQQQLVMTVGNFRQLMPDPDGDIALTNHPRDDRGFSAGEVVSNLPDWFKDHPDLAREWDQPHAPRQLTLDSIQQFIDHEFAVLVNLVSSRMARTPDKPHRAATKSVYLARKLIRILQADSDPDGKLANVDTSFVDAKNEPWTLNRAIDELEVLGRALRKAAESTADPELTQDDLQRRLDVAEHSLSKPQKLMFQKLRDMKPHQLTDIGSDSQSDEAVRKMAQRVEGKLHDLAQLQLNLNINSNSLLLEDRARRN